MYCSKCRNEVEEDDVFCSKCGIQLNPSSNGINVSSSGDYSPNIGNGIGNRVKIDEYNVYGTTKKIAEYTKDVGNIEFKQSSITLSKFISMIVSIIGFIASTMTILDFETTTLDNYVPLIMMFSVISFGFSLFLFELARKLKDEEFAWIKLYWWTPSVILELTENKKSYRLIRKISGICPKCGSDLRVRKSVETSLISGVCKREPKAHRFKFEHSSYSGNEIDTE